MDERLEKIKYYAQWALGLFMVVLCGYFSADFVALVMQKKYTQPPRIALAKKVVEEKEKARSLDDYINDMKALFPKPAAAATASTTGSGQEASSVNLGSLKLVATLIGEDSALAVITVEKKDEVVGVGQTLGNYTVKTIEKNRVILESGGQEMALRLKFGEQEEEPKPVASPTPENTTPGLIRKEVSRREFETMTDPPDRVAREVGFAPISREGKPYGIQLTFVKPGSFLQTIGFLPGDVLASINNKSLYTPEEAMLAYQMMKNEDTVDFKIDRGGRFINLQIVFK
jgi:type II secretion system protein C